MSGNVLSRRPLLLGALAAPLLIGRAAAQAPLVLASGYPDANFHTRLLRAFAARAKELTNGALDITIHSNASLIQAPAIKRAVQGNQVQLGEVLLGNFGNEDAIFEADSVPFLAAGYPEAKTLYAAQKPMLEARLGRQGITLLHSIPWPGNGVFSRRELPRLADLAGMKVRTYNALTQRLVEHFRATSVIIQVPDVPQAFMTGVADAMVTSTPVLVNGKSWDYGRFWHHLQAFNPRNALLMNTRALRALPAPQQEALRQAAAEIEPRGWAMSEAEDGQNLATLTENGVRVVTPSPAMVAEMRAAGEAMIGPWAERAGPDGVALKRAMGR